MADEVHDPRSDEQLAGQAQAGCVASFDLLARRWQAPLLGFLTRRCGSRTDAEDLVQESLIRAYRAIDRFDTSRSFATWLFTIAHRLALNHHRDRRAHADQLLDGVAWRGPDAADELAAAESHTRLWEQVRQVLDEERFTMLWLRVVEEMEHAQIARVLGKTSVGVRVGLHRARKALQKHLTDDIDPRPEIRHAQVTTT